MTVSSTTDQTSPGPSPSGGAADAAGPGAGGTAGGAAELSAKAVDTIDLVVANINDKAIRPLLLAARALVFGIVAGVLSIVVLVVASVAIVRLLDVYAFGGRVWASEALLGGIFVVVGLLSWSRRSPRPTADGHR